MMAAGAVLVALPFLPLRSEARAFATIGVILAAVVVLAIYSWWLWHKKAAPC